MTSAFYQATLEAEDDEMPTRRSSNGIFPLERDDSRSDEDDYFASNTCTFVKPFFRSPSETDSEYDHHDHHHKYRERHRHRQSPKHTFSRVAREQFRKRPDGFNNEDDDTVIADYEDIDDDVIQDQIDRKDHLVTTIKKMASSQNGTVLAEAASSNLTHGIARNRKNKQDEATNNVYKRVMVINDNNDLSSFNTKATLEENETDVLFVPLTRKEITWLRRFIDNPSHQIERSIKRDEARVKLTRVGTSKYANLIHKKVITSHLSEDTFSFLISSKVRATPFITSILIVTLKATLFGLIGFDMFKNGVQGNELAIPASVTVSVTISQFFAIFIAVATQDDLITSLNLVFEGYSSDLTLAFNGASLWKWVLAVVAYIIEGTLGLFVTFLLIVTSHEVVELLLNFTAVEFVSLLDNVAFLLAKKGFMGTENRSEAMLISKTKYRVTTERKSNPFQRIISLGGIAFMLLSGWAIIFARQLWGVYLPNQITVQFEDTLSRELGTYSGTYYRENDPWKFDQERVRYISASGRGQFQYCLESRFWTFSAEENPDPCHNFIAKSSQTLAFDLTETLTLPWLATESLEEPRFYPMSYFYLALGCVQDYDCGGIGHGTCHHNQCTCNDKYFGIRCDYFEETTCEKLDVDISTEKFKGSREFSVHYQILRGRNNELVKAYDRPIFVGSDHARHLDIMMYVGVRWVLFDSNQGFKYLEEPTTLEIADYFLERGTNFHASELQNIEFITEPIKFDSPLDKVTPTNERWYSTRGVEIKDLEIVLPLDIVMLCEICDEIANPCFNGNRCLPSGQCLCSNGATGKLCQIRPLRDGRCHQAFNTPTFDFDGGDCCKSTCISTDKNSCGVRNEDGKLESVNVGFPDCIDPLSKCVGSGCWSIKSHQIPLLTQKSDHGLKSLVKLSANGRILVLSEPALDAVRVFDQIDSRWIQRGQILEGDRDSGFGRMSSISSTPGSVFGRRFGRVPLELAIVHFYEGHPWIRAFRWLPNDADWRVFTDIDICSFLAEDQRELCDVCTLDIGSDHDSVTVAIGLDNGKALIFRTDVTEIAIKPWHLVALMDGHHVSLSGDSHRLATAVQYGDTISLFRIVNSGTDVKDTMLIPIDQHIISTHFNFDLHNGAPIDYSGYASHIEKIQLSSDGGSLALAAYGDEGDDFLLHYTVSIDRIGYDAAKRIKLPEHSQSEKLSGLTTIYFSDAASLVAVRNHLDESHDEVQIFEHKMVIGGLYTWGPLGRVFDSVTPEEDFSISHDGTSIVFGGQVAASVYELHDRCREEEVHFRLSIILDAYPVNVTWSLQTVRQLGHLQIPRFVLKDCDHCYNNNDRFGRKSIVEEVCVPKEEINCLSLVFQAEHGFADGSGFAAFLEGVDLIKSEEGDTEPVVWTSSEQLANECQLEVKQCSEDESLFILAISLDRHEEETYWDLIDSNYNLLGHHKEYSPELSATTVVHEVCIPKDECVAFTLHDSYGDGSCCDYGDGGYKIWLEGELYESGDGGFGSKIRILIGDSCPIHDTCSGLSYLGHTELAMNDDAALYYDRVCQVNPISCPQGTSVLVLEMTQDIFPEEVVWHLYDQQYNLIVEKTRYSFEDMLKTNIHQMCVPDDQCLAFVFEDSIGDGEHEGRGYVLYLDGEEVVNRHESSVGRERDNFGSACPTTSAVTIEINFDDFPQETGWSIIDSSGIPVIEVFAHTYTQEYDRMVYTFQLVEGEVFQFSMKDDNDNGICCAFGEGNYGIYLGDKVDKDKQLVAGNGRFKSQITQPFLNSEKGLNN